ncbi:MAG: hypothetical protein ACJAZ9_001471 [Neolewinella sp.]|jgi:hypothetical protein
MIKYATLITSIGFILLVLGVLTLFLNMVGVDLVFMEWLYKLNVAVSFAVRLGMIVVGLVMIYVGRTDWNMEEV